MRTKILTLGFICLFVFILTSPIFGEDFSLSEKNSRQKSSDEDTIFTLLQYSAWALIDVDTVCTYNSYWNYGRGELNPYLRGFLPPPELVFILHMTIKLGVIWTSRALYKKSKIMAYTFLIVINVVKIYFILDHITTWHKMNQRS